MLRSTIIVLFDTERQTVNRCIKKNLVFFLFLLFVTAAHAENCRPQAGSVYGDAPSLFDQVDVLIDSVRDSRIERGKAVSELNRLLPLIAQH